MRRNELLLLFKFLSFPNHCPRKEAQLELTLVLEINPA